jgi:sulfatase modifying factor 1
MKCMRLVASAALLVLGLGSLVAQESGRIRIDRLEIDRTEVTVGAFRAFLARQGGKTAAERDGGGFEYAGGWVRRAGWFWSHPQGQPAGDTDPVTHVSWDEARTFCADRGGRLPTLAEWRRAAFTESRATPTDGFEPGRTYRYAVGDTPEGMNTNRKHHVPVGTTRRGVNGLYDMGANVWEWLADRRGEEALTAGGSWWYGPEQSRAEGTQWKAASFTVVYIGFRCVYGS